MKLVGEKLNIYNGVYHGLNDFIHIIRNYSKINFLDTFVKYVFNFSEIVKPIYPNIEGDKILIEKMFKENNLIPRKTVLISPYAGHADFNISDLQWKKIVYKLKQRGYSVCTNCYKGKENALPGSVGVFIDLKDSILFTQIAGFFIGVRSGFCDLICMSKCKKIVIYEKDSFSSNIEFFGFNSMNIGENIIEIENGKQNGDLVNEIISLF